MVWHSEECQTNANEKMAAHRTLTQAIEVIEPGARERSLMLARAVIKEAGSKRGDHCELAFLTLKLFAPKEV